MITWRADNPETPPPMMQIFMASPLIVPSSRNCVWPLSAAAWAWGEHRSTEVDWDGTNKPAVSMFDVGSRIGDATLTWRLQDANKRSRFGTEIYRSSSFRGS
jgi:hypothetical protein